MASKPSSPAETMEDLVTCSVCLENFTDPRALPCVHSYCKACLERLVDPQGKITCPQCRIEVEVPDGDVSNFNPNFFVNSLLEMMNLMNEVTLTTDCNSTPHCQTHVEKACELYCEDCSRLICYRCIAKWGNCHIHSYTDIEEAEKKIRKIVEDFWQKGAQQLHIVKQHLALLDAMKAKQVANIAEVCEQIEETFEKHMKHLKSRKDELYRQAFMYQLSDDDKESLNKELDRVQVEQAKITNMVEFCTKMLEIDNPVMFIQKYYGVKDKVFGSNFQELISHVDIDTVRFEGNDSLLNDVIASYGSVADDKENPKDEKPKRGENDEVKKAISDLNLGQKTKSHPQEALESQIVENQSSGAHAGTSGTPVPGRPENSTNNATTQPVYWKFHQKIWAGQLVSVGDEGLSVKSRSPRNAYVIGIPGFRKGKHSWKVKLENMAPGLGIGVCVGSKAPGICVMFDKALIVSASIVVTVELDCDAKCVKVTPDGCQPTNFGFQNQDEVIFPYFTISPQTATNGKLMIIEMDGKPMVDKDCESCSIS